MQLPLNFILLCFDFLLTLLFYKCDIVIPLLSSTHGVVLDSTGMCRAVNAAVGNHKPKTK